MLPIGSFFESIHPIFVADLGELEHSRGDTQDAQSHFRQAESIISSSYSRIKDRKQCFSHLAGVVTLR